MKEDTVVDAEGQVKFCHKDLHLRHGLWYGRFMALVQKDKRQSLCRLMIFVYLFYSFVIKNVCKEPAHILSLWIVDVDNNKTCYFQEQCLKVAKAVRMNNTSLWKWATKTVMLEIKNWNLSFNGTT